MTSKTNEDKYTKTNETFLNKKKRRGDRSDGWILKELNPFTIMVPYLMKTRTGSSLYIKEDIDMTKFLEYINKKNKKLEAVNKITYFNLFTAALVRTFALKPHLNRFVLGKKHYQRKKIEVGFVVKKVFSEDGAETTMKERFERDTTIQDVVNRLNKNINQVKDTNNGIDETEDLMKKFIKLPRFIIMGIEKFLGFLDFFGKYPEVIRKDDPMHCSVFLSNLGSIGIENPPYHHLYDRGTCSIFICMGKIHKKNVYNKKIKEFEEKDIMEVAFTLDERITDGFYYINAINFFKEVLSNPEVLETKPDKIPIDF
ncbi:MAG: 2-oxo acid dehydrogenase subunit E2 [Methanobacteriaceae archaeon]